MKRRASVAILAVGMFLAAEAGSAGGPCRGAAVAGVPVRWRRPSGGTAAVAAAAAMRRTRDGSPSAPSARGHGFGLPWVVLRARWLRVAYYGGKGYYGHGYGYGYTATARTTAIGPTTAISYYGGYPYYGYGWSPSLSIGFNYVADSGYGPAACGRRRLRRRPWRRLIRPRYTAEEVPTLRDEQAPGDDGRDRRRRPRRAARRCLGLRGRPVPRDRPRRAPAAAARGTAPHRGRPPRLRHASGRDRRRGGPRHRGGRAAGPSLRAAATS